MPYSLQDCPVYANTQGARCAESAPSGEVPDAGRRTYCPGRPPTCPITPFTAAGPAHADALARFLRAPACRSRRPCPPNPTGSGARCFGSRRRTGVNHHRCCARRGSRRRRQARPTPSPCPAGRTGAPGRWSVSAAEHRHRADAGPAGARHGSAGLMNRNGRWQSWVKLGAFGAAGVLSAVLVINTLSVPVRGSTVTYQAQFTSIEGLNVGNPVSMNGIRIGRVDSIRFAPNRRRHQPGRRRHRGQLRFHPDQQRHRSGALRRHARGPLCGPVRPGRRHHGRLHRRTTRATGRRRSHPTGPNLARGGSDRTAQRLQAAVRRAGTRTGQHPHPGIRRDLQRPGADADDAAHPDRRHDIEFEQQRRDIHPADRQHVDPDAHHEHPPTATGSRCCTGSTGSAPR